MFEIFVGPLTYLSLQARAARPIAGYPSLVVPQLPQPRVHRRPAWQGLGLRQHLYPYLTGLVIPRRSHRSVLA